MDHLTSPTKLPYMQNRELSWLDFNKRVLDQGADPSVPLLERLNFISIFWSNLQEFFMVRVGSLTDLSLVKKTIIDSKSGMTAAEQLDAIYARCHELYPYYEQTYEDLRDQLAAEGIEHVHTRDLTDEQRAFLDDYVHASVTPFLSPQIINARHPFPHLENGALYIVVRLDEEADATPRKKDKKSKSKGEGEKTKGEKISAEKAGKGEKGEKDKAGKAEKAAVKEAKASKNLGAEGATLGLIPLPRQCERVVHLPGKGFQFTLLEHVIEMYASEVFSMYKVKHTNVICVTRNADLDATEGTDEQGEDYREHMKRILKKRARLAPVRLESERELSSTIKPLLLNRLNLKEHQTYVTSVPLDLSYTFGLAGRAAAKKRPDLTQTPFTPQWPASLERNRSIIDQVSEREMLLSYPYESMDAFVQLLREAAADPKVLSIRITLYRLASQSHLAEALIAAAEAGKEVTALFELRARFDESNNIEWSQRFEQAGCHVIYGFRDFKVHSKICCITRQTDHGLQHITQLGTGNYNEKTARLYTDYSFITTDPLIGRDAVQFFRNMALENASDNYDILWVAPLQIKQNILAGIDEQISRAKRGLPTGLFFKTNSVTDKEVIDKIAEASQAGVPCTLFVRGISCIVPGVAGYTDNVRVVSIVGRLLEHSRIYCFGPTDDCKVYLSSADLMTRNMDKRIEIAWPILNDELRKQVLGYLATCMRDTAKLRELLPDRSYTPLGYFAQSQDEELFDSQAHLIEEAQRRHLAAAELAALTQANRSQYGAVFAHEPLGEEVSEFVDAPAQAAAKAEATSGEEAVATAITEETATATTRVEAHAASTSDELAHAAEVASAKTPEKTAEEQPETEKPTEEDPTAAAKTTDRTVPADTAAPASRDAAAAEAAASADKDAAEGVAGGVDEDASERARTAVPPVHKRPALTPDQAERVQEAARLAGNVASAAVKVAGGIAIGVAKGAGEVAAHAAKAAGNAAADKARDAGAAASHAAHQAGADAADAARAAGVQAANAARNMRGTTARAAREAAKNTAANAADAARETAKSTVESTKETALARREASAAKQKKPTIFSRLTSLFARKR